MHLIAQGKQRKHENEGVEKENVVFFVGQKFCSVRELETAKKIYEDRHFCELWKRDVRTLASAAKRVPKRVVSANPDIAYYSQKLSCKFGGKNCGNKREKETKDKIISTGYRGCNKAAGKPKASKTEN
ncbi:hypothetical protein OS493_012990 [Desmophyllum pertusum]|uniref:Uncharacterized protein n=1 Tax=Desmophyllum pertusum TaxID=174260 RepID=A0A9W9Z1E8_9CNID|nr:hypothetical protein OS493_012990 [Desmophyllum pertusum]